MIRIEKILIANRGEIAVRICKASKELGIKSVAIYADDDKESMHVSSANEAVSLGSGTLKDTYLNIPKIIDIALHTGCNAIHPGYGFLSENAKFSKACEENGIIFIGPSVDVLETMGNKTNARNMVKNLRFPIIEGFEVNLNNFIDFNNLQFPIIIKPTLGGGGKGIYITRNNAEWEEKITTASRESQAFFANPNIYCEHYIETARHIEVQILADNYGNIVHLFERECTLQRNFQKIIEEAPSPTLSPELRNEICNAAINIAKAVGYTNAGTVEFLLDENLNWYFIEMNTRIQVEHPVTELITGIDLVQQQIRISNGEALSFTQGDIKINGHAIEVRINTEDPMNEFRPSAGEITYFKKPPGVRFETYINGATQISSNYDSLLGKLIVAGNSREDAIYKLTTSIDNTHIHGVETNISFIKYLITSRFFKSNEIYTRLCNTILPDFKHQNSQETISEKIIAIGFVFDAFQKEKVNPNNVWEKIGYWRAQQKVSVNLNNRLFSVQFYKSENSFHYLINDEEISAQITLITDNELIIKVKDSKYNIHFSVYKTKYIVEHNHKQFVLESPDLLAHASKFLQKNEVKKTDFEKQIKSPLYGKIIKLHVSEKEYVNTGDILLIIESMKVENQILAPGSGIIKAIYTSEGAQVKDNAILIELE